MKIFSRFPPAAALALIILAAAQLRFFGLSHAPVLFYDEAIFILRAEAMKEFLIDHTRASLLTNYTDTKLFWITLVMAGQFLFKTALASAKILSALAGVATVAVTYLFAKNFYRSYAAGILSALLLSVSSFHIFYSRLGMPDVTAALLLTLSVYFFWLGLTQNRSYCYLSGLCWGLGLLCHYRSLIFVIYFLILAFYARQAKQAQNKTGGKIFLHTATALATVIFFYIFQARILGITTFSWFEYVPFGLHATGIKEAHPVSFWTAPFYLMQYESLVHFLLIIASVAFLRAGLPTAPLLLIVLVNLLQVSFLNPQIPRGMVLAYPFVSVLCAATLLNIADRLLRKEIKNIFLGAMLVIFIVISAAGYRTHILNIRSGMGPALEWVNAHSNPSEGVLSDNKPVAMIYTERPVRQIFRQDLTGLKEFAAADFKYLVLDPQKYILSTASVRMNEKRLSHLLEAVETVCRPVAVFDHFDGTLAERYFFEHSFAFQKTLDFISSLTPEDIKVKVYEIKPCIQAIEKK